MSWGTCYKATNNIHFNFPAMMSDARIHTNWDTACNNNERVIKENNIQSNFQYRQFLINNSQDIINSNMTSACDDIGARSYPGTNATPENRYLYKSINDNYTPYGYENSDLKNMYLSKQQLQSRMVAPIMSQYKSLNIPRSK
tara:strand:+ start:4454 stop:4879 length:426 start_codon:yes stop_codon:yes gene_type:complete